MKIKAILLAALLLALPHSASALSLVCDPYPSTGWQPEYFTYQIETGKDMEGQSIWAAEQISPAVACPDVEGSVWLHLDISGFPKGITVMRVKAQKVVPPLSVEESEYCPPFLLSKDNTQKEPGGFGLR